MAHDGAPQRTLPAYTAQHERGKSDPVLAASAKTRIRRNIFTSEVSVDLKLTETPMRVQQMGL